jgi:hypothetical protein
MAIKQVWDFILKLLGTEMVTLAVLPLAGVTINASMWIGVIMAVLLYGLGDWVILRAFGNTAALVADGGVAFLVAMFAPPYFGGPALRWNSALLTAALMVLLEQVIHRYILRGPRQRSS